MANGRLKVKKNISQYFMFSIQEYSQIFSVMGISLRHRWLENATKKTYWVAFRLFTSGKVDLSMLKDYSYFCFFLETVWLWRLWKWKLSGWCLWLACEIRLHGGCLELGYSWISSKEVVDRWVVTGERVIERENVAHFQSTGNWPWNSCTQDRLWIQA